MTTFIPAEPAPYSWLRKAMKFKITKVGLRACLKAEPTKFVERTDFRDLRLGGRYFTLDEMHAAEGDIALELRSFSGNTIVMSYDGKHVTFA